MELGSKCLRKEISKNNKRTRELCVIFNPNECIHHSSPVYVSLNIGTTITLNFLATRSWTGHSFRLNAWSSFLSSQANEQQRTFRRCSRTWVLPQDTAFDVNRLKKSRCGHWPWTSRTPSVVEVVALLLSESTLGRLAALCLPSAGAPCRMFALKENIFFFKKTRCVLKCSKNPTYLWYRACKSNSTVWRIGIQEFFSYSPQNYELLLIPNST